MENIVRGAPSVYDRTMDFTPEQIAALVSRWTHLLFAVIAIGGACFMRFVLHPAATGTLDETTHQNLRAAVVGRWRRWVMISIALLLASGFYNYLEVTRHLHKGQALYNALFGVKFLLAMGVFLLAGALTGRSKIFTRLRERSPLWQGVLITLAVLVILIAGVLKSIPAAA